MFYVYIHLRLDTGEIFYVGKGQKKRAWETRRGRSPHWTRIVELYGRSVHIHSTYGSDEQALAEEVRLIHQLRQGGYPLVNITDGGQGPAGRKLTPEQKFRVSEVHKGKALSLEHREAISKHLKGRPSHRRGKKLPTEHTAKINNSGAKNPNYGRKHPGLNSGPSNAMWGKPSPNRRFTDEQIMEIECQRGEPLRSLATRYGCSRGLVKLIRAHKARPYLWN
jgi:hypothetical protein